MRFDLSRGIVRQHIGEMKTEASRKPVPMDAGLADVLIRWREMAPYNQDEDYIFASPDKNGHATLLADRCEWKITSDLLHTSRNSEACRLAHVPPHVRNAGEQQGCRRCYHAGADATR